MRFLSFGCSANREEEHTKEESVKLFGSAHKSIKIIAGNPGSDFYRDARIVKTLNSAIKRGVDVEIAYYPKRGREIDEIQKSIPGLKILKLKEEPPRHLSAVDSKHVRIERKHLEGASNTPALICRDANLLAKDLESKFAALEKI